jgi:hypothetical protein
MQFFGLPCDVEQELAVDECAKWVVDSKTLPAGSVRVSIFAD